MVPDHQTLRVGKGVKNSTDTIFELEILAPKTRANTHKREKICKKTQKCAKKLQHFEKNAQKHNKIVQKYAKLCKQNCENPKISTAGKNHH